MIDPSDIVGTWDLPLADKVHKIEFEHGTTSGKRVIRVDGKEIFRRDWMFKLVGKENFKVGKANCTIAIEAVTGFAYEYTLEVNGKPLKKFRENQSKIQQAWEGFTTDGGEFRVCLEKDTLDIWVNGKKVDDMASEFGDDGVEYHFMVNNYSAMIKGYSSGKKRTGIMHALFIDDKEF